MKKLSYGHLVNELIGLTVHGAPLFIVLIGAPGSGKSTFISKLSESLRFKVASTDDQVDAYAAAHGLTYTQAFSKVNSKALKRQMMADIDEAVKRGLSVVVDQTNMHSKSRKDKLAAASARHVKVGISFDLPDKVLLERLDKRAADTGKVIPRPVVFSMLKSYEEPTKAEGFDHVFELSSA